MPSPTLARGVLAAFASMLTAAALAQSPDTSDWGYYGGDVFGHRYSGVAQIDRGNVTKLQVAWTYRTGELGEGFARQSKMAFEATPVLAFGLLYLSTPTNIVIALDPVTGKERWRFDPRIDRARHYSVATSRGVTVWEDLDTEKHEGPCAQRIFAATLDARLFALSASTGKPCADFGKGGVVDLTDGLRIRDPGDYNITSPPAVFNDLVIVGSAIGDNRATDVERGIVRAFDAHTGALRWSFDPLPDSPTHAAAGEWREGEAAATGAANAWAVMSVDPDRGLVFVPTGSASPDFFGGKRAGDNRFANSVLALEAATGKLVWNRQLVHHDLWDYDLAAQPVLAEMDVDGAPVATVIQATKTGMLFVFDRDHGGSIFSATERRVPASDVRGERAWPTQLFPNTPMLTSHAPLRPREAWGITFWDRNKCRQLLQSYRNEGLYTPPSERGTILSPSYVGGVNWGGVAFDVRTQRAFAAVNHLPMVVTLLSPEAMDEQRKSDQYPRSEFARQRGTPYAMRREPLLSPWGLPCTPPPWGTLVSVDLRRNRVVWQVPLGSTEGIGPWFTPTRDFGLPSMGGPIVTAGDLVFIGAAMDGYFRAFDLETGRELWKHRLPAGGQATPMTYRAGKDDRQYVVIAAGGHGGLGTPQGDYVVAFALPRS